MNWEILVVRRKPNKTCEIFLHNGVIDIEWAPITKLYLHHLKHNFFVTKFSQFTVDSRVNLVHDCQEQQNYVASLKILFS